jgi:hypothetical protein
MPAFMEQLLKRGHYFGLRVNGGWIFAKVLDFEDTQVPFDRYSVLTTVSGNATIGSDTSYWLPWKNAQSVDIFWEKDSDKALQCFIGIYPPTLRWFRAIPSNFKRGNLYDINVDVTLAVTSIGFISGYLSPREEPTELTEMILPMEVPTNFGVFNPEGVSVYPSFLIFIRRLRVKWMDPKVSEDLQIIKDILTARIRCKFWSPGVTVWEYDCKGKLHIDEYKVDAEESA